MFIQKGVWSSFFLFLLLILVIVNMSTPRVFSSFQWAAHFPTRVEVVVFHQVNWIKLSFPQWPNDE